MNNLLLLIGALLVAVLAALFAVPHFVDWNSYRGVFEREASRLLGREVQVLGSANLRLLPSPYLRFEKVRISGSEGPIGQPVIRADAFTAWLAVAPLLKGTIEAREVAIDRLEVRVTVDDNGGGDWARLAELRLDGPGVPSELQLNKVKINQGSLLFLRPDGGERTRISSVNGEFSAQRAVGPYRSSGKMVWDGVPFEFALSTATPDADGGIYVKADLTQPDGKNRYGVEGTLRDLFGKPQLEGQFFAALSISDTDDKSSLKLPPVEVRSSISATTLSAGMKDVVVAIDPAAGMQRITGSLQARWQDEARARLELRSDWLDLDRVIAGGKSGVGPLEVVAAVADALTRKLPSRMRVDSVLEVGQISLGQQTVGPLRADLLNARGDLVVRSLTARLPGGGDLFAEGTVGHVAGSPRFAGRVALKGTSIVRLANWLSPDNPLRTLGQDGPFNIAGRFSAGTGAVEIEDFAGRVLGTDLSGAIRYEHVDRRRLFVRLAGSEFDAGGWLEGGLNAAAVRRLLAGHDSQAGSGKAKQAAVSSTFDDIDVQAVFGLLEAGGQRYRNVRLDATFASGRISMRSVRFQQAGGASVKLNGDITLKDAKPVGRVSGVLTSSGKTEWLQLAQALGAGPLVSSLGSIVEPDGGGALAFVADLGTRLPNALDLQLDGTLGKGRAMLRAKLDGGLERWQVSPSEIDLDVDDLSLLTSPALKARLGAGTAPAAGQERGLKLFAKGTASRQLGLRARLTARDFAMHFRGVTKHAGGTDWVVDGAADFDAADVRSLLAVVGLPSPEGASAGGIRGSARIVGNAKSFHIADIDVASAANTWTGWLKRETGTGISGELATRRLSVTSLLGLLQKSVVAKERASGASDVSGRADEPPNSSGVWSDAPFDLSFIEQHRGKLRLAADEMATPGNGTTREAILDVQFEPAKVALQFRARSAAQGHLTGESVLEKQGAGYLGKGRIALEAASLSALVPLANVTQDGQSKLSYELSYVGNAVSPRGMVAVAAGKGRVRLTNFRLPGFAPVSLATATRQAFTAEGDITADRIAATLRDAVRGDGLLVDSRDVAVNLTEGALRLAPMSVVAEGGRIDITTTVDVASMTVDSEWRFQPDRKLVLGEADGQQRPALPPVEFTFVGALRDVGQLEPRIDASRLVRELTVLKMEKGVDELERLRREDEERARKEAERLKALEEARARDEAERILRMQEQQQPAPPPSPQSPALPSQNGTPAPPAETGTSPPVPSEPAGVEPIQPPAPRPAAPATAVRPQPPQPPAWIAPRYRFPDINSGG